jgi:MazG family protein
MPSEPEHPIERLRAVMARLRDPERGCPWDLAQRYETIAPHTLEECYELIDAIERGDIDQFRDELGDVLFQVIFYCRIAEEQGDFTFATVVEGLVEKLIRRHPHVFGEMDACDAIDAAQVTQNWEQIKQQEREQKALASVLDDIPATLPALSRAAKLQRRAARVGFDWTECEQILDKLDEERTEVAEALISGDREAITDEIGDLLFVCVNLARYLDIDPEAALRGCNRKFERRFRHIEAELQREGRAPADASLAEMDALWEAAKLLERGA